MAEMSPCEQLLLELVNRARLDPKGEASRHGIRLNSDLPRGALDGSPRQPLAPNESLVESAAGHTRWMLAHSTFSHCGVGASQPGDRMKQSGYSFFGNWNWGENLVWREEAGRVHKTSTTFNLHRDLFLSPDHRYTMLNGDFREAGISISGGKFKLDGSTYKVAIATENFALSGPDVFVTGVAFNDRDRDTFYDIGEGRPGISVSLAQSGAAAGSGITKSGGGYAVAFSGGTVEVTFSGGGLPASVKATVEAGTQNAKVDLADTSTVLSSASTALGVGAYALVLLGTAPLSGTGNDGANSISGNRGANTLDGKGGDDVLHGGGGRDLLIGGDGADRFDFDSIKEAGRKPGARDHIIDFVSGQDRIDLSTIDANVKARGNQAFDWIGSGAFHHEAGELRYFVQGSSVVLAGDTDGNGRADFQIELERHQSLARYDIIL